MTTISLDIDCGKKFCLKCSAVAWVYSCSGHYHKCEIFGPRLNEGASGGLSGKPLRCQSCLDAEKGLT